MREDKTKLKEREGKLISHMLGSETEKCMTKVMEHEIILKQGKWGSNKYSYTILLPAKKILACAQGTFSAISECACNTSH